jgi:CRISPR-associated RAMP protein (TIGR02581 family)
MAWLNKLESRYLFTGSLLMESGLHIGGGRSTLTTTDSAVMKYIDDRPFIPGSSMKGAFRSAVERVAASLSAVRSCGLLAGNDERCPNRANAELDEDLTSDQLIGHLCDTCHLFGSQLMAAKIRFADLCVLEETWSGLTEVRDGVGIDRDSECAVPLVKYDYEVVPSQTAFQFRVVLENPDAERHELGLVAAGLRELESGMIPIGGIRTRGLGRCSLKDLRIFRLRFGEPNQFKAYLKAGSLETSDFELSGQEATDLLNQEIDSLFA